MTDIQLLFCGDYSPGGRFEQIISNRSSEVFGDLRTVVQRADLAFLNLESPVASASPTLHKSGPTLGIGEAGIKALAEAGFDVVSLANNHIMDFGEKGLYKTIRVLTENGVAYCGAGRNLKEAARPAIRTVNGRTIAIFAIAETEFSIATRERAGAFPLDAIDNFTQIQNARATADLVFFSIHGGNEYFALPRPNLRKLCRFLVDVGADGVFCHHPHVPGAYEIYKEKPIVYSLGNLIFDHASPPPRWDEGYAAAVRYDAQTLRLSGLDVISYNQSFADGGIALKHGEANLQFQSYLRQLNQILADDTKYLLEWERFCKGRSTSTMAHMLSPILFPGVTKVMKTFPINKFFYSKNAMLRRLNVLRCESHRDVLIQALEDQTLK